MHGIKVLMAKNYNDKPVRAHFAQVAIGINLAIGWRMAALLVSM
jgi:hypothetical protein